MIVFKQLKTVQNVYFSYLEAGDIDYLSFRISEDSELEKWPDYPDFPYNYIVYHIVYQLDKLYSIPVRKVEFYITREIFLLWFILN